MSNCGHATFITKPACPDRKTLRPLKRKRNWEKELERDWDKNERETERHCMGDRLANGNEMAIFFETYCVDFHLHHSIRVNKFPLMKAKAETSGKHFFLVSVCPYALPLQCQANESERERERDRERQRERGKERERQEAKLDTAWLEDVSKLKVCTFHVLAFPSSSLPS